MSLHLAPEEKEIFSANIHWSNYIFAGGWAFFGFLVLVANLFSPADTGPTTPVASLIGLAAFFFLPLTFKFLKNKCKTYAITNRRLYVEEGIFSKSKIDLPFAKVYDIQMKQSITQRIFGSGDVMVFSGNSIPVVIKDIESPNEFKEHLFTITNQETQAA